MTQPPSPPAGNRRTIPIQLEGQEPLVDKATLSRRRALKLLAASLASTVGACAKPPKEAVQAYMAGPEHTPGEGAVYYASAYVREGYAHGVLIGTQDGRPTKIEGNPLHPASLGATDVYAQASVLELWDPDRSQTVARRIGTQREAKPDATEPPMATASWRDFENAWAPLRAAHQARRGKGMYLLTGPFSSPTLLEQIGALQRAWPEMKWAGHVLPSQQATRDGARLAFGRALEPIYRLDAADVVLSLGDDAFCGGAGSVRHAHDWAKRRSGSDERRPLLLVAETSPSLIGARADRRVALNPADLDALIWRLAGQLSPPGALPASIPYAASEALLAFERDALARLKAAGPSALVMAGPSLSPSAHAAVHWINHSLGNRGRAIDWIPPVLATAPLDVAQLMSDLQRGEVESLWIMGCNPVYELAQGNALAKALGQVPFTVHLGQHLDETAAHCAWHLPESQAYEQWSDAKAHDGTVTILQPAMAPLYDTRSCHEVLALIEGSGMRNGRELVKSFWRRTMPAGTFESSWRQALTEGRVEGTQHAPATALPPGRLPAWPARQTLYRGEVYLDIAPDPALREGALANNAWLQEWPRPLTQLTWGNALYLAPATARTLGVVTGDVVNVRSRDGAALRCPAWVLTSHAEGAATLHAGHGRWSAGHVGNGVGVNANLLRTRPSGELVVSLTKAAERHDFAVRQHEMSQHGRELARVMAPGVAASAPKDAPSLPFLYPNHPPPADPVHAWAMVVDLDACIGCGACTIACQAENNIPTVGPEEVARGRIMHWLRVDVHPQASGEALFQPVPCMHCENAPCELVCPVGATLHDSEGLNAQVYNRCIGTRFCSNNCPYKVRRFNFLQYSDLSAESLHGLRNPDVTVRERGVMEKCTYCVQRIARARRHAERSGEPLRDGDVVTACQAVCPTRAITFGDLQLPGSEVNQARRSERHYAMLGELNTRPRTTYLARRASPLKGEA